MSSRKRRQAQRDRIAAIVDRAARQIIKVEGVRYKPQSPRAVANQRTGLRRSRGRMTKASKTTGKGSRSRRARSNSARFKINRSSGRRTVGSKPKSPNVLKRSREAKKKTTTGKGGSSRGQRRARQVIVVKSPRRKIKKPVQKQTKKVIKKQTRTAASFPGYVNSSRAHPKTKPPSNTQAGCSFSDDDTDDEGELKKCKVCGEDFTTYTGKDTCPPCRPVFGFSDSSPPVQPVQPVRKSCPQEEGLLIKRRDRFQKRVEFDSEDLRPVAVSSQPPAPPMVPSSASSVTARFGGPLIPDPPTVNSTPYVTNVPAPISSLPTSSSAPVTYSLPAPPLVKTPAPPKAVPTRPKVVTVQPEFSSAIRVPSIPLKTPPSVTHPLPVYKHVPPPRPTVTVASSGRENVETNDDGGQERKCSKCAFSFVTYSGKSECPDCRDGGSCKFSSNDDDDDGESKICTKCKSEFTTYSGKNMCPECR